MVFSPPKAVGLALGVAALTVIVLLDVFLVAVVRAAPPSFLTFICLCLFVASLPVLAWLAYRCYGLARARYVLSRNALVVEWGGRREVIPLDRIGAVHAGTELADPLRPPRLSWPGCVAGRVTAPGQDPVEFAAASAQKPDLVFVNHPGGWLALSPEDPQAFLAAFRERQAEGVEDHVAPESRWPAVEQWPLWRDRLALALIALGIAGALLLVGYLTLIYPQLPPQMALHFDAQGRPDRFGPASGIFILPVIAAVAWTLNTLVGVWLHRRPGGRAGACLLFGATVFVQALVWAAAIGLLTAGRA